MHRVLMVGSAFITLAVLLAACNLLYPASLTVTPTSLNLTSSGPQPVLQVEDTGDAQSSLSWTGTSNNPRVTLVPSSGADVSPGKPQRVALLIHADGLSVGQVLDATITISSNSQAQHVSVHFAKTATTAADCGISTAGLSQPSDRPSPSGSTPTAVPGQIIVQYAGHGPGTTTGISSQTVESQVVQDHHLRLISSGHGEGPSLVEASDVSSALAALRADPRVAYAQRNYYVQKLRVPTDPCYQPSQWNLYDFGLPQAWDIQTGNANSVVVAIIDDGVDSSHPDLRDKMLPGWDFYYNDSDANPGPGQDHGTHVAGIAAAMGDNLTGIAGVAFGPQVKILPVKIFDNSGGGATLIQLVDAMRWAAGLPVSGAPNNPYPAQIINMSLGVPQDQPVVDNAAQQAFNAGALLVAAAGNYGSGTTYATDPGVMSPANAPAVIAVGSVNSDYHRSAFSVTTQDPSATLQTGIELMAPGGFDSSGTASCPFSYGGSSTDAILSTFPSNNYGCEAGTSMASPFVAGVAALLKSQHPTWTPSQLRASLDGAILYDSSYMTSTAYGLGVLCADKALGAATTCGQ